MRRGRPIPGRCGREGPVRHDLPAWLRASTVHGHQILAIQGNLRVPSTCTIRQPLLTRSPPGGAAVGRPFCSAHRETLIKYHKAARWQYQIGAAANSAVRRPRYCHFSMVKDYPLMWDSDKQKSISGRSKAA